MAVSGIQVADMADKKFDDVDKTIEMSTPEAIIFLSDQLSDESARSEAYRGAAIALLDHIADEAVESSREERRLRRESDEAIMNMHTPVSTMTH